MATLVPVLCSGSSASNSSFEPGHAFDGDSSGSRWQNALSALPAWLEADYGAICTVTDIQIVWHATAYATSYTVDVSTDRSSWTNVFTTTSGASGTVNINGLSVSARFIRVNCTVSSNASDVSIYELSAQGTAGSSLVVTPTTATATSSFSGSFLPANLIDGNLTSRWANDGSLPDSFTIDLGSEKNFDQVGIFWESAYPTDYTIELGDNGGSFTTVDTVSGGSGTYPARYWTPGSTQLARYIRVNATVTAAGGFYSAWEAAVFSLNAPAPAATPNTSVIGNGRLALLGVGR